MLVNFLDYQASIQANFNKLGDDQHISGLFELWTTVLSFNILIRRLKIISLGIFYFMEYFNDRSSGNHYFASLHLINLESYDVGFNPENIVAFPLRGPIMCQGSKQCDTLISWYSTKIHVYSLSKGWLQYANVVHHPKFGEVHKTTSVCREVVSRV